MKFLCHEAGASLVESITSQQVATQKIVILVAEEVDDEMFLDRVFPSLVDKGVLPAQCKAHIPHSQIDDYKIAASATAPIVYFSWLVECIAADMAVPIFPFSLGNLYLQ